MKRKFNLPPKSELQRSSSPDKQREWQEKKERLTTELRTTVDEIAQGLDLSTPKPLEEARSLFESALQAKLSQLETNWELTHTAVKASILVGKSAKEKNFRYPDGMISLFFEANAVAEDETVYGYSDPVSGVPGREITAEKEWLVDATAELCKGVQGVITAEDTRDTLREKTRTIFEGMELPENVRVINGVFSGDDRHFILGIEEMHPDYPTPTSGWLPTHHKTAAETHYYVDVPQQ